MAGAGRTETLAHGWTNPRPLARYFACAYRALAGVDLVAHWSLRSLGVDFQQAISSAGGWADVTANVRRLSAKVQRSRALGTYSPSQRRLDKGASLNGCDRRKR